jgi:hypothetical protein
MSNQLLIEYQKWRTVIFSAKPEQVGISGEQADQVYGVVLDVALGDVRGDNFVITITAFATGETSVKSSIGGGIIGLGGMKEASEHATRIVDAAQSLIGTAEAIDTHDLPEAQCVFFYFLTTSGLKVYQCKLQELTSQGDHPYNELFFRFTEIKKHGERAMSERRNK